VRTLFYALSGFLIPIAGSLALSAYFFGHSEGHREVHREGHREDYWEDSLKFIGQGGNRADLVNAEAHEGAAYQGKPSVSIASRDNLDPSPENNFLVSFYVRLEQLPEVGARQHLIGKYAYKIPYEGWAVGLRRLATSVRPEVYWRGQDGSGGWFSFDEMVFEKNEWYAFTVAAKPGEYLNLFYQRVPGGAAATTAGIANENPVVFAGGQDLASVVTPKTEDDFKLGIKNPKTLRFSGEIREVLVSYPKRLPKSFEKFPAFIAGGAVGIVTQLKEEEVNLWSASRAG